MGEARRIDLEPVKDVPYDSEDKSTWGRGGKAELLVDGCQRGSPHSMMFIGTGGHKTMNAASTQYAFHGSTVFFDPSCEIGPMLRQWREKLGQRVVFIGKRDGQIGIDVLACIQPEKPDAQSRILSVVASMCGEESNRSDRNSVFDSAGRNLIACLLTHMMYSPDNSDQPKTIETFVEGITIPELEMQDFMKQIQATSPSMFARRLARIVMSTHKETFSGAYFNATQMVGYLLDETTAKLLSGPLKPWEILNGGLSIYVQIPMATLMSVPGIGRLIVDSIVTSVIAADGDYAEQMLFQADEAWLLGPMKSLQVVLKMGRKYGMPLNLIYTSLNEARQIWTEQGMDAWLDGLGWCGFAAVSGATAAFLSKELGTRGVMAYSEGENSGTSAQTGKMLGGSWSSGTNVNVHEISNPLIRPEEFKDCRTDELFILPRTGRGFRCGMAPYYRRPEMESEIKRTTFYRQRQTA